MLDKFLYWMLSPLTRRIRREVEAAICKGLTEHRRLSGIQLPKKPV